MLFALGRGGAYKEADGHAKSMHGVCAEYVRVLRYMGCEVLMFMKCYMASLYHIDLRPVWAQ